MQTRKRRPWRVGLLVAALALNGAGAAPFTPTRDDQVLERLGGGAAARNLRQLSVQWAARPNDAALATRLARTYLERGYREGDPRFTGRAQAVLAAWQDRPDAPAEVLVLRATILQRLHAFRPALAELERALARDPRAPQAWLTRATVLAVLGEHAQAKRSCLPLFRLSTELVGVTCLASVASRNGQAARSADALQVALERARNASVTERQWALGVLADAEARAGRTRQALAHFRAALALGEDPYLRVALADLLLDLGRAREAQALTQGATRLDAALLRLIQAEQVTASPGRVQHVREMQARLDANRARGDTAHQREAALFALHILRRPAEALRLAQLNWAQQHEPIDARLLLESALAARQSAAARPALAFVRASHLEDPMISRLVQRLGGRP